MSAATSGTPGLPLRQLDSSTVTRVVQEKHSDQAMVRLARLKLEEQPKRQNHQRVDATRLDTYA